VLGTFAAGSAESAGTDGNETLLTKPSKSAPRAVMAQPRPTPKVWSGAVTWNLSKAGALSGSAGLGTDKREKYRGIPAFLAVSDAAGNSDSNGPELSPGPEGVTKL
jgi:hypothetical protein